VIQLIWRAAQTGFYVSQTFAIGKLRERHAQELVPAGETARPIIAAVARHASAELTIRKEGDQLRKNGATKIHPSWWQPRVHLLDFQIAAR
jgi:hypothetical protein